MLAEGARAVFKGNKLLWSFEPLEAAIYYHQALDLAQQANDEYLLAEALFGIGQSLWYNGKFSQALDTVQLSVHYYKHRGNRERIGGALRVLANIYDDQGDYENAFKTVTEGLQIFEKSKDNHNQILLLVQMADLYKSIGDYETASSYYRQAQQLHPHIGEYPYREMNLKMGEMQAAMGNTEKAREFYQKALTGAPRRKLSRLRVAESYLQDKKYDIAFSYLDSLYREAVEATDINIIIASMLGLGKVYLERRQLPQAMEMVQGSLERSAIRGARQNKRDAYQLLSAIYEAAGNNELALTYYKHYEKLKDSVVSGSFRDQLFTFRQEAHAARLESQRDLLLFIILGVVALFVLILFIFTLRHKNEKLHLRHRATELEMQALRAQMNPHFIFNCLSSINHFILNNEADAASEYLTRFSRLIRMVLVNAGKPIISLEEELAMLRLYLDMEQLRFASAFEYFICFDPDIYPAMIHIPSFMLQPFCENAIWHGLLHKEEKGRLSLHFKMENETLLCIIKDNGIGRQKADEFKKMRNNEKMASFGSRLTTERLALFNGANQDTSFVIEDITDNEGQLIGTMVTLRIKSKQVYD